MSGSSENKKGFQLYYWECIIGDIIDKSSGETLSGYSQRLLPGVTLVMFPECAVLR